VFDCRRFNVYAHLFLGPGDGTLRFKVMSNGKEVKACNNQQLMFVGCMLLLVHYEIYVLALCRV
jgi:hypothetical protein